MLDELHDLIELGLPPPRPSETDDFSLSFLGVAFSEPRLLALGYAFEQATHALRTPALAPPLPGETLRP